MNNIMQIVCNCVICEAFNRFSIFFCHFYSHCCITVASSVLPVIARVDAVTNPSGNVDIKSRTSDAHVSLHFVALYLHEEVSSTHVQDIHFLFPEFSFNNADKVFANFWKVDKFGLASLPQVGHDEQVRHVLVVFCTGKFQCLVSVLQWDCL